MTPMGAPVLHLDEQIVSISPKGVWVNNRARKLLFFFEANCHHRVEGLAGFDGPLHAGDVLVLPHFCRQLYRPNDSETTRIHALRMVFDPAQIPALTLETNAMSAVANAGEVALWMANRFSHAAHLRGGMNAEVRETLARLRRETEGAQCRATGSALRVGAACLDLTVLVARQLERETTAPLSRGSRSRGSVGAFRVEEAREFTNRHLEAPLSLGQIAAHLDISPEHLARVWKNETGTTIFETIRRARIERAKSLLIASDLNISQIARECGFSSLALFSRNFKTATGVSPVRYRGQMEFAR